MKTKLTSLTHWAANTPPTILCIIFALFLSLNAWADPIAIGGTGTVTLNYENTSNPVSPTLQKIQRSDIFNNERSIAFSNPDGGYASRDYDYVEWATTIEPGIYEVEIKYGSFAWNVTPLFAVYQNNSKIKDIYVTTAKNSGGWKTWADFSPESFVVDLTDGIDPNTNYTIRATETFSGAWGLIIGHISFTPFTSHFATWGYKTGENGFDDGAFPSNSGVSSKQGVSVTSDMSFVSVSQGTYAYKFGSESYVEIYVGAGRVITDIATSVLCDGNLGGEELQISFSSSTPFNQADASKPVTFASNSWSDYCCTSNPSLISLSASIPEGTKSAKITKSASATHDNYLYRLKVVAEDAGGDSGDEHTVYFESSNNNYGTVDVASISSVPDASTVSIDNNVLTLNGTDVTATPVSATAEYTYAFSNWSVSNGDEITENQTITATFTRTANSYTLTWDLNGGTVTTAGTGAAVNATGTPNSSVAYGTAITAPVVSKAGYSFVGWNATPSSTMPAANTTYTAQWQGVPAVTNLNAAVDDDDVTISWTNYNKLDLTSDNAKEEGWNDYGTINSRSVANGVLTVSYTTDAEWAWKSIEIPLSREMNHVTSIDMQYTYNNAQAKDGNNEGGIAPYMMYNEDGGWTCFWKRSDPTSLGFWASNVTEYTNYNLTPDQILGNTGSGSYDNQRLIHKVGLLIDPAVASSGTFTVKDICINTTDGQTTLDEIKVIRKLNSAPTSISDGDEVYSGVLNTFTDNNLENGTYYYAVYARKGSNYSEAVTTGPVQIGPETYGLSLHEPGKYEDDGEGGYGRTLKTVGDYQYEVYRFAYVNDKGALYAGSESTVTNGYALITNATSSESVGDGWVAVKPYSYVNSAYTIDAEFAGSCIFPRFGNSDYLRLYVQGYDQFSFAGRDDSDKSTGYFKIKIDGVEQDYTINRANHITRYSLTANEPHIIEITGANSDYHNRLFGFSLRLPVDDTPRSVTYAKGNVAVTGDLPSNTSYAPETEVTLPEKGNLTWTGHVFIGWDDGTKRYAAGETYTMPAHDVTLTAQWAEIHQPGKYETPEGEDGYGRSLTSVNNREYEVYRFAKVDSKGALYAGSVTTATDGHMIFNNAAEKTEIIGDNWIFVKPYDYSSTIYTLNAEFTCSSGYARIRNNSYVRLYVQGYDQFAFAGRDDDDGDLTGNFVVKIDGVTQDYTINRENHISDRYSLTSNDLHVIEITAVDDDYHNRLFGFSLRLPVDDTPRSLTYAKGDEEVTGDLPTNTSYAPLAEFTLPNKGNLAWAGHAFIGWSDGSNRYAAGETYTMPAHDVTFTAQWAEIHQPGKYETATASGGYGRTLQTYNNREYEVYEVAVAESKGALYAGPSTEVTNGYQIFTNATNATEIIGDNWVYVKARDYNADIRAFGNEFGQLNSEGTLSPQSARLDNVSYVRLYVQGYDQFTFIGIDSYENIPNNYFVIKIDGVTQSYTPDADHYNYTRYDLDESIAHVIEVTANSSDYHNRFFGFSLRLPADDTQRSVTYAKGNEAVTGDLPASGSYVWGETFDLPAQGTLSWTEHYFIGWNDGTATYAPGYTYTMPREAVTFTAQWLAPEYIPTTTSLNSTNVYVSPGTVEFNVDGEGDDEECINIAGKQTAEWKVYFTRGIYKLNMLYGTTSGGVNVTFKIFDGDTELTAYTRNDNHNDGSGVHLYNAKWDLDLRTIDENKLYTVKVIDTWGDTSSKPRVGSLNFSIVSPIVLSDTPVQLTHENVTFSPGTYNMDVDGIDGDETCVDIRDQQKADWLVQITPGYYQISMLYGTPGGTVKVQVMIIDAETGEPVEGKVTTEDIHYSGSSFLAKWGMDLRTGIDENKTYFVRVKDVFGGDGSKPEVAYINMVSADPITVSSSVKTKLDHNNVTTPYTIEPFDIEDNGSNETCLFIGDNNQADWLVKIAPITYNIRVRYGRTTGTRLTLYIIDGSNHVVWNSDTRPTPSGRYEVWEINGIDLSDKVNATDEYIIRIKDDYDGAGSKPYIEYIEFIPKVTHTRTNLRAGDYGTICLPYAVAAADRNGAELFELEQWADNGASLTISQLDADEDMEAGKPYIFQATANTATFSYYPEGDAAEAQTYNGLIGKYEEMEIPMNDDNYIIYNNKLYLVNSANIWVGANRAYIHKGGAPMNQAPANRRRVTLGVYGTQTATGFDPVTGNPSSVTLKYIENGHLFIIRDGKTYNAQGQVVK